MQSRKYKDLLPIVAIQLSMSPDVVQAVSNFFWERTRKALAEAPKLKVHVPNLGDFTVKHWVLEKQIKHYTAVLARLNNQKKVNPHVLTTTIEKLNQLKGLQERKAQEDQRKDFIHEFKKSRGNNFEENIITDLEE
jgi:hypothetical protein